MNTAFNIAQINYDCALPSDYQSEREGHVEQLANEALDEIIHHLMEKLNIDTIPAEIEQTLYENLCKLCDSSLSERR